MKWTLMAVVGMVLLAAFACTAAVGGGNYALSGTAGWHTDRGLVLVGQEYYANVLSHEGSVTITTVDKASLKTVTRLWSGDLVLPCNSAQTLVMKVMTTEPAATVWLVDGDLQVRKTWTFPGEFRIRPHDHGGVVTLIGKKTGIAINPEMQTVWSFAREDTSSGTNSISRGRYTAIESREQICLLKDGRPQWQRDMSDVSHRNIELSPSGAVLAVDWIKEGKEYPFFRFTAISVDGSVRDLGQMPTGEEGQLLALSANGKYAVIGLNGRCKLYSFDLDKVVCEFSDPGTICQLLVGDDGRVCYWALVADINNPLYSVSSKLVWMAPDGTQSSVTDVWPTLPEGPLDLQSMGWYGDAVDIISSQGEVSRYAPVQQ